MADRHHRQRPAVLRLHLGDADRAHAPLFGQAGRQIFFIIMSIYGWWRWHEQVSPGRGCPRDHPTLGHRGGTDGLPVAWVGGGSVAQWVLATVGAVWPAPRWYFWFDAWILVGSIIATFAMARGWVDFWLCWIGVDVVGVPLLLHSGYIPTATLYAVYGGLVIYGFFVWLRASRAEGGAAPVEASARA